MAQLSGIKQLFHGETLVVDSSQKTKLGDRGTDANSIEYIYLQGTASITARDWVTYDENFAAERLVANAVGPVAVAPTAVVLGQYGWFQIYGTVQGNADSIIAGASLYVDGIAGRVDDLSVSGDLVLNAYSMTASVNNIATCYITYPTVSNDLGGTTGNINLPTSSTDNAVVRWDGTAGNTVKNSSVTIDDVGNIDASASIVTFGSTSIHILDIDDSHDLVLATGSNLTADRKLNLITGDASRSITLSGNINVEATANINQDLTTDGGPNFGTVAITNTTGTTFTVDDTTFVVDAGNNRVGIGTHKPASALDVSGTVTISTPLSISSGGIGTAAVASYAVVCGGTATTQPLQVVDGLGSANQVLTSNGAGALPTWQAAQGGGAADSTAFIEALVFAKTSPVVVGDGRFFVHMDSRMNSGSYLTYAHARHINLAPQGTGSTIDIANTGLSGTAVAGTAMMTQPIIVDTNEVGSHTSAAGNVISNTGSAVLENDLIRIDVDEAGSTGSAEGLIVTLGFSYP